MNCFKSAPPSNWRYNQCICLTMFSQVFLFWHAKTCTKNNCTSNWHPHSRSWQVLWLVKKKTHMSINTLEIEMTRIPRQLVYFKLQLEYLKNINQIEDPWCSYACFSLWAWILCNGLGCHLQHLEKHARPKDTYTRLIGFSITNQNCILIIQNISFPKIEVVFWNKM